MIGTVTAKRLNVRSSPDSGGRKLGQLSQGAVLFIHGKKSGWFEIQYQDHPAFVYSRYVKLQDRPPRQAGVITATLLNVRDRPSGQGSILGTLAHGSRVDIVSRNEGWLEISFHSSIGFVSEKYVDVHSLEAMQGGTVTAGLLNVRSAPSNTAQVLGQLSKNTDVVIESTLGDWYEIPFNRGKGYVSSKYILVHPERDIPAPIPKNEPEDDEETVPQPSAPQMESRSPPLFPGTLIPVAGTREERSVATTWNTYGGLLETLSHTKDIDVGCAVAVLCVESSGRGFDAANRDRMIIRFENHKFWKFWGKSEPERFRRHFTYKQGQAWKGHTWRKNPEDAFQTFHGKQPAEWEVLDFARSIENDAALLSISMGAPQIMGFHFEALGYHSVQEMFDAFCQGIEAHIRGLFDFLSPAMVHHLQALDFTAFAALYNGSGQKETYGRWIGNHFRAFKRLIDTQGQSVSIV